MTVFLVVLVCIPIGLVGLAAGMGLLIFPIFTVMQLMDPMTNEGPIRWPRRVAAWLGCLLVVTAVISLAITFSPDTRAGHCGEGTHLVTGYKGAWSCQR